MHTLTTHHCLAAAFDASQAGADLGACAVHRSCMLPFSGITVKSAHQITDPDVQQINKQHAVDARCSRLLLQLLWNHSSCAPHTTRTRPSSSCYCRCSRCPTISRHHQQRTDFNSCAAVFAAVRYAVPSCANPSPGASGGRHHLLDGPCTGARLFVKVPPGPQRQRAPQPLPGCWRRPEGPRHVDAQARVWGQDAGVQHETRHLAHPAVGAAAHRGLQGNTTWVGQRGVVWCVVCRVCGVV